jgi:tetratricopeptide (TPR) repeat protein
MLGLRFRTPDGCVRALARRADASLGFAGTAVISVCLSNHNRRKTVPAVKKSGVVRCRPGRMAEYLGKLLESRPEIREPFELGFAAMNTSNWGDAIRHFQTAVTATNGPGLVALHNLIGVCHYTQGRLDNALKDFEESARLADQYDDKQGKSRALGNIGRVCHDNGDLDRALVLLEQALALSDDSNDPWATAIHLGYTGNVHHEKGELDRALQYYEASLEISRDIGDQWGVATQLANIGEICHDKGDLDKALEHHQEALAIARETGDRWCLASNLDNIGSIYRDKGDLDQALKIGHQLGVATGLGNIGLILADRSEHEEAVPKLAEALTILLAIGVVDGPRQTLTGLSGCEDKLGRKRLTELLKEAGRAQEVITDLFDRIDQLRMRRPD